MSIFPVTSEADPGADTVAFDSYDSVGMAKIITNYADDLPRADVKAQRTIVKVFDIATSYGYSIKDIRRAKMTGKPLTTRKAESARRANDALVNKIAFQGDAEHGILGILNIQILQSMFCLQMVKVLLLLGIRKHQYRSFVI